MKICYNLRAQFHNTCILGDIIMWDIIVVLFYIIIVVGLFIFLYYKIIPMSDKTARFCEIIGYALLIVFIIWQMAIKDILLSEYYNDDWYFLNQKLHIIFNAISTLIDNGSFDTSSAWETFNMDSGEYINMQLRTTDWIEFFLQFFSTIGIAIGRFQELKSKKEN